MEENVDPNGLYKLYILKLEQVFKIGSIEFYLIVNIRDVGPKTVCMSLAIITDYHLIWLQMSPMAMKNAFESN